MRPGISDLLAPRASARTLWAALALVALCASVLTHACSVAPSSDCGENGTCSPGDASSPAVDAGLDSDVVADSGSPAADVVAQDGNDVSACDLGKDPRDEPCLIDESYGVFVAAPANGGDDRGGDGTKAMPYATIHKALQTLQGKTRVYVCNQTYAEQVTLTAPASLYGGLACPGADAGAAWSYVGGVARVNSPSPAYAIKIDGVTSAVSIEDFAFAAPDAHGQDANGNGQSSIAGLVNGSIVTWKRVALTAGRGAAGAGGADGTNVSNYSDGPSAPNGTAGMPAADGGPGTGQGGSTTCANGSASSGGGGGAAGSGAGGGGDGQAGSSSPVAPSTGQNGSGGKGGLATCGAAASPGANGLPGAKGAAASTYGTLAASGWLPGAGGDGQAGGPGQGGGGGGGITGIGGSGGGAGGCGGSGGAGGKGGGGSIALASFGSTSILVQCQLTTSDAGNGGTGGKGQDGQGGGGAVNMFGCAGASGGNGAGGSGGAGGTGGVSVAIVYGGTSPSYDGFTTLVVGAAGARGMHGSAGKGGSTLPTPGNTGNDSDDGHPGIAQSTLGP